MQIPEEIPVQLMQEDPVVTGTVNLFGDPSAEEIADYDNRVRAEHDFTELYTEALPLDNAARNLFDYINRQHTFKPDPDFKLEEHLQALKSGVPPMYWDKFTGVQSLGEAMDLRDNIIKEVKSAEKLADSGIKGTLARMAAGAIDGDILIPFVGPAKKMSMLVRTARGAAYGAGTAAITEGLLASVGETNDWGTLPAAMLMGGVLGGAVGAAVKQRIPVGMSIELVDDLGRKIDALDFKGDPDILRPFGWSGDNPQVDVFYRAANDFVENTVDPVAIKVLDDTDHVLNEYTGSSVFAGDEGTLGERAKLLVDKVQTNQGVQKGWVGKVRTMLSKGPLADDATRMWNSGSNTLRALAVSLFEFADGLVVNNRSGAILSEHLFGHTYKVFDQVYSTIMQNMYKKHGLGPLDFKKKAALNRDINRQVLMAANDLDLGRVPKMSQEVQDILAGVKDLAEKFRREAQGGSGVRPVPGFENMKERSAYIHRAWSPDAMRGMLRNLEKETGSATAARNRLVSALRQAYQNANPDMDAEVAEQVARALVRRQLAKGDVQDTNLQAMLQNTDSRELLAQAFRDNGVPEEQVQDLLRRIAGQDTDKGKVSFARRRTEIDLAGTYDGIAIIDLVDNDLQRNMLTYSDSMSKRIALSRHGIDSKQQMSAIKRQALNEMKDLSTAEKKSMEEFIDYMFEYFEPGTVDKHINPWMRRAKASTNLSLLSKLSLTQSAETGAIIAATGMQNFIQASKVLLKARKHKVQLMDDLGFLLGNLAYERGLMRSDYVTDTALDVVSSSGKLARAFDNILVHGQYLQSTISGYTHVIEAQLNLGALASTNKIFRALKAGTADKLTGMFSSMGLNKSSINGLQKLIDNGTIKFTPEGHVDALNVQAWPARLREDYSFAALRLARQMTQRSLAGESFQWLHDSSWAIFGHLQNFPLTAMRKQFLRNAGRKDGALLSLATWGMGTATVAAVLHALTEGTEDGLSPDNLARRAFSLNNAMGWVAPGIDLFAVMTGLEEYSPGGRYSRDVSIPLLSVATRAIGIPEAMVGLLPGMEFDKSDKRAMQVLPVIGSAMFMGRVWDAARTDTD